MNGMSAPAISHSPKYIANHPGMPGARPLYLSGTDMIADTKAAALLITMAGRASSSYPIARVSRVIVSGRCTWTASALQLCLKQRVSIVFIDREGTPYGHLQPTGQTQHDLARLLDEFLDRPDWQEQWVTFVRAERMRHLVQWRKSTARDVMESHSWRELVRRHVYCQEKIETATISNGWLLALAIGHLDQRGLQAVHWGFDGVPLKLAEDITALLRLALHLDSGEMHEHARLDEHIALHLLHIYDAKLDALMAGALGRLAQLLARRLHEWR